MASSRYGYSFGFGGADRRAGMPLDGRQDTGGRGGVGYGPSYGYEKRGGPPPFSSREAAAFERRFHMNTLLMPSFLETPNRRRRIAKMIFFTGKYCCILRECGAPLPDFRRALFPGAPSEARWEGVEEGEGGSMFPTTTTTPTRGGGGGGSAEAAEATSSSFFLWENIEDLHRMIQRSFEIASQTVIRLLFSPRVDLLGHLANIKLFFLHSQGDWVTDFLDSAEALLGPSPDTVKAYSLRVLLQASIARSCCAHQPYHDRVSCRFSDCSLEQHVRRCRGEDVSHLKRGTEVEVDEEEGRGTEDALRDDPTGTTRMASEERSRSKDDGGGSPIKGGGLPPPDSPARRGGGRLSGDGKMESADRCMEFLELEVDLKWPVTVVLDATVMARFNSIFRLLTWLKVCERRLCTLWTHNSVLASFPAAYGLKHQLIQFLRQFQFFAAHFVLEPLWIRLIHQLDGGSAESLFSMAQALHAFFTDVERRLTISSASRFKSLRGVLTLVSKFCEVGKYSSAATMPLIESTLMAIQDQFLTGLSELAAVVGPDYAQLVPLLTFIDFNGFYEGHNVYHVQRTV